MPPPSFDDRLGRADARDIESFLQRLMRHRDFLHVVLESLNEGIVVTDTALKVLLVNGRAMQLLRMNKRRRIRGRVLPQIVRVPEVRRLLTGLSPHAAEPLRHEVVLRRRDAPDEVGQILELRTVPMRPPEGEAPEGGQASLPGGTGGLIVLVRDLTRERRAEAHQRTLEQLASLATLTGGVAHEIKNPLNSLSIHAQLMDHYLRHAMEHDKPADAHRLHNSVQVILEETRRLADIVDEFLAAVRPTRPSLEPRDLNALCQRVAELFQPEADRRGVILDVRLDPDLGLAQFDERQLMQAIVNLVKNGLEAIDQREEHEAPSRAATHSRPARADTATAGGAGERSQTIPARLATGRVVITTRGTADRVLVQVEDDGAGMPPETLKRIFEPFFTTKFHGTGLGLMNVHRIVTEHEGTVHVSSQPGEGTVFVLNLPRRAAAPVRALPAAPSQPIPRLEIHTAPAELPSVVPPTPPTDHLSPDLPEGGSPR
jgi:signal transduction histidine kinase